MTNTGKKRTLKSDKESVFDADEGVVCWNGVEMGELYIPVCFVWYRCKLELEWSSLVHGSPCDWSTLSTVQNFLHLNQSVAQCLHARTSM